MKTTGTTGIAGMGKRKLIVIALLLGLTVSQLGCGCECATVATAVAVAAPAVMIAREVQEARKTELEIERLESEKNAGDGRPKCVPGRCQSTATSLKKKR